MSPALRAVVIEHYVSMTTDAVEKWTAAFEMNLIFFFKDKHIFFYVTCYYKNENEQQHGHTLCTMWLRLASQQ